MLKPSIVADARVAGTWKRTFEKDAVIIEVIGPFAPLNKARNYAINTAAERYGRFLNLPAHLATKS